MDLLTALDLTLKFNQKTIFSNLQFSLQPGHRVALVGVNGSGKTSLLRILAGEIEPDEGEIVKAKETKIGYLPQEFRFNSKLHGGVVAAATTTTTSASGGEFLTSTKLETIEDYFGQIESHKLSELELKNYQDRKRNLIQDLKFEPKTNILKNLSGGQQRLLGLIHLLSLEPDILLLDEPTNHLDITSSIRLQQIIRSYPKTILFISHDRYFIDATVDTIWELDQGEVFTYKGGYTEFLDLRRKRIKKEEVEYERRAKFLDREKEWVISGVQARGTKDTGRLNRYYELKEFHKKSKRVRPKPFLPIPKPEPLGNRVLELKDLTVTVPNSIDLITKDLNFEFQQGFRVGILGPNGSGKTTLLETILGNLKAKSGKISIGINSIFNYQDQKRLNIDLQDSLMKVISQGNIRMKFGDSTINVYAYLKKFGFKPEQLKEPVSNLSGGQRARLLLALILRKGGNFLILDEPTNDLDVDMLEALENSILQFPGCILLVSHDRFFLDKVCTHIIALEGSGNFTISSGGYSNYMQKYGSEQAFWEGAGSSYARDAKILQSPVTQPPLAKQSSNSKSPSSKQLRKQRQKVRDLEKRLKEAEEALKASQMEITSSSFFAQKPERIQFKLDEMEQLKKTLSDLEDEWLKLSGVI
jgi:ATP-binding cassette subfamily F protein uup